MKKFLLVFVVAGLALAGCGGSSAKDTDSGGSGNTTAGGGGSGDTSNEAFNKLLDLEDGDAIRVTYDYGEDNKDVTISRNGEGKVAFLRGDEQAIFSSDSDVIQCENLDSTPECKQFSGAQATALKASYTGFLGFATNIFTAVANVPNAYGDQSSEEIAGRDATCATVTLASAPGIAGDVLGRLEGIADAGYKVCADEDTGILLKFETVGVDEDKKQLIVATEVGEPEDSDFEPPAEPEQVTIPSMPEITLPGGVKLPSIPGVNP